MSAPTFSMHKQARKRVGFKANADEHVPGNLGQILDEQGAASL